MKSVLSKLLKPYELYLKSYFKMGVEEKLELVNQEIFYSMLYFYPNQKISPNTTVEIPLELYDVQRKNLKLVYILQDIDHENKKVSAKLKEIKSIYYHGSNIKTLKNINVIIKDKYYVVIKVLLAEKINGVVCSRQRKTNIRKQCAEIFKQSYKQIEDVVLDVSNRKITSEIVSKMSINKQYVKGILLTKFVEC